LALEVHRAEIPGDPGAEGVCGFMSSLSAS
jgi:hypothetical protein